MNIFENGLKKMNILKPVSKKNDVKKMNIFENDRKKMNILKPVWKYWLFPIIFENIHLFHIIFFWNWFENIGYFWLIFWNQFEKKCGIKEEYFETGLKSDVKK